jgi:hypothetical protein
VIQGHLGKAECHIVEHQLLSDNLLWHVQISGTSGCICEVNILVLPLL